MQKKPSRSGKCMAVFVFVGKAVKFFTGLLPEMLILKKILFYSIEKVLIIPVNPL